MRTKKWIVFSGCLLIACMVCIGCARAGMRAYTFEDAQAQRLRADKDHFRADEVPTLCVYGYGGQKVTVKVFDVSAARAVREQTAVIPEESNQSFWWGTLSPGSYQAVLYVDGVRKEDTTFSVTP